VADGGEQPGDVAVVEAGDGVAEADGVPAARLAASWRIRRSPPEVGSSPACRAVMAASQSMEAIGVVPSLMLVPCWMNRLVKSPRCRNVPWLMSSATPASAG
jgi:hypothetical protein